MKLMILTTTTNWRKGWGQGGKMELGWRNSEKREEGRGKRMAEIETK